MRSILLCILLLGASLSYASTISTKELNSKLYEVEKHQLSMPLNIHEIVLHHWKDYKPWEHSLHQEPIFPKEMLFDKYVFVDFKRLGYKPIDAPIPPPVPIPPAIWLFGSALLGGLALKRQKAK